LFRNRKRYAKKCTVACAAPIVKETLYGFMLKLM